MTVRSCLKSMRLRTLPLSLAGITLGVLLAAADYRLSPVTVLLLALTTVCLQILSNLSNELGDTLHGTDTDERAGIHYAIQDGEMTIPEMKRLITVMAVLCCLSGALMIRSAFGTLLALTPVMFLLLGAAAIWAAMHYTLGEHPYGYRGLGDLYVFLFFGIATVCGGYFICAQEIPSWILLLPAAAIGCFSVAVLNVNNIRDMKTDAATRTTVALKLGAHRARVYQTALIALGWVAMLVYCQLRIFSWWHYLFVLTLPLFLLHLRGVWTREDRALDPMLPLLVMSSFAFALLGGLGFVVFLF
ncbi:MAG: 1,4-dihydroxy-2-naphthoate octaprenyltransferase [Bacteroidales bacterium]|nr:1,4-dihydroxy-2-naphthoate octaprenyltransferase [Bacteroidales bacterium]